MNSQNSQPIQYRGYTIEEETEAWPLHYGLKYRYYRDGDEYLCHAYTIEEAKDRIWEKVMAARPDHIVIMNGREYPFTWLEDAIKFADLFKGKEIWLYGQNPATVNA